MMLTADLVLTIKVGGLILCKGIVSNRLLGPGFVLFEIITTALLLNIYKAHKTIILKNLITFIKE